MRLTWGSSASIIGWSVFTAWTPITRATQPIAMTRMSRFLVRVRMSSRAAPTSAPPRSASVVPAVPSSHGLPLGALGFEQVPFEQVPATWH